MTVKAFQNKIVFLLNLFIFITICHLIKPDVCQGEIKLATQDQGDQINYFKNNKLHSFIEEYVHVNTRILMYGIIQEASGSTQNPGNQFLSLNSESWLLNVRPDFFFSNGSLDASFKPRFDMEWIDSKKAQAEGYVNEWLVRWRVSKQLFFLTGRENLQWGPSLLSSPSNPFFDDNGRTNPTSETPGMDFVRAIYLLDEFWTLSLIYNYDAGRNENVLGGFNETGAIKFDYIGLDKYGGLIASYKNHDRGALGIFGGITMSDALLLFGEASLSEGTNALYPTEDESPFGASLLSIKDDDSSLSSLLLVGGSYTTIWGPTLTLEYIYNGYGYDEEEVDGFYALRERASNEFISGGAFQGLAELTLQKTLNPGLRFLRKNYLMAQYLHNSINDTLDLTLFYTYGFDDKSGAFSCIAEYYLNDFTQIFAIGNINNGSSASEFGSILKHQWTMGLKFIF